MLRLSVARAERPRLVIASLAVVLIFTVGALAADAPVPAGLATVATLILVFGCFSCNLGWFGVPISAPSSLFMAATTAFHLGLVVPWEAGFVDGPVWLELCPERALVRALLCVAVAFGATEIGLLYGWRGGAGRRLATLAPVVRVRRVPSVFYTTGLFLAGSAIFAAFVNIALIGLDRFVGSAYGFEFYAQSDSRFVQMGLFWLLPSALLVSLAGARPGRETTCALLFCTGATLMLLWVGNRGGAVSFAAAASIPWTYKRGAIALRTAAIGGLGLLLVLPTAAALRQIPRNAVTLEKIGEAAANASPLKAFAEMGGSLRPLVETLRLVPGEVPYRYGRSYLSAALRVVPNAGLSRSQQSSTDPADMPPNHWITYTVDPWTYANFGGLGFSAVAEPYLNFGLPGILLYFVVLGFYLGRTDVILGRGTSRRTLALAAVVFMPLLLTVRNDFHNFLRPALWSVCMVLLIERVHGVRAVPPRVRRPTAAPRRPTVVAMEASAP